VSNWNAAAVAHSAAEHRAEARRLRALAEIVTTQVLQQTCLMRRQPMTSWPPDRPRPAIV